MSVCPGCGVELPDGGPADDAPRHRASPECWGLYGEVAAYTAANPALLGRWHQTCVDAYGSQHTRPATAPITTAFALNGLYMAFERRMTGFQIREAHGHLASTVDSWPRFTPPPEVGEITVFDVALASSPEEHIELVRQWGSAVWVAWMHVHDEVAEMTDRQLRGWWPGS